MTPLNASSRWALLVFQLANVQRDREAPTPVTSGTYASLRRRHLPMMLMLIARSGRVGLQGLTAYLFRGFTLVLDKLGSDAIHSQCFQPGACRPAGFRVPASQFVVARDQLIPLLSVQGLSEASLSDGTFEPDRTDLVVLSCPIFSSYHDCASHVIDAFSCFPQPGDIVVYSRNR